MTAPSTRRPRRADLDRAKGLAILLVVFGHLVARQDPEGVAWYEPLRHAVYLFHMPFFFYLSGTVAFLTGAARTPPAGWRRLAARRAQRLLLPFALFGAAILAAKLSAARLMPVDNVPASLWQGLADLLWHTDHSPAGAVWYLLALFVYSLATPGLLALDGGRIRLLALVAVALYWAPVPPLLYLDRICGYAVFFVAGGLAAERGEAWLCGIDRARLPVLAAFALLLALVIARGGAPGDHGAWMLGLGLLSMPALHALVRAPGLDRARGLLVLGRFSFAIYLLNTVFIGLAKGGLLGLLAWQGAQFVPFAAALMLAGTLGPMLAKRYLLRRVPVLDRMTD